jgi:hypothetical protein
MKNFNYFRYLYEAPNAGNEASEGLGRFLRNHARIVEDRAGKTLLWRM